MPNYVGTSPLGLQSLGVSAWPDDGSCSIRFNGLINPEMLERVGTLLVTNSAGTSAQNRTLAVFKLYGHGIVTPQLQIVVRYQIPATYWVVWFRPQLAWRLDTL